MYQPTKLFNRFFVFIWIVGLTLCTGQATFNSTITVFANEQGFSNTFAGSLSIWFLIGALIGRYIGGRCTDTRTRREGMIIGTAIFFVATVLFCLPLAKTGIGMMLLRFMHGIGWGCATTTIYVAAVDVAPKDKKTVALGINLTGQALAFMMITLLLGLFVTDNSYTVLFIVTAVLLAISIAFSIADTYEGGRKRENAGEKKEKYKMIEPAAIPYAILVVIYDGAITLPFFYVMPLAVSKGLASGGNNIFVFVGIGMLTGYLLLPRIEERTNTFIAMLPAYICGFLSHTILVFTNSNMVFSIAGFFYGMVIATLPLMQNATVRRLPDNKKGSGTATLNGALDITMGVLPVLWGMLIDHIGFSVPFMMGAVMYAVALVAHIFVAKREKPVPDFS